MAKQNKYLQNAKNRKKTKINIDLQQMAVEYSRLLNKKFCYVFSGGIEIQFQFKMENFYHLLGFHKLTDVTVVHMVESQKLKKEDFFKYVKDGMITMDSTDSTVLDSNDDKVVNIQDSDKKSALGEIKAHRFQFFSEINVLELLKNDPVIDFESDECTTVIDADKVFFKFITEKNRNLNLFIGYDATVKKHFVSTFFVESEKDKYLIKNTGESQSLLKILSRKVIDTQSDKMIDFYIKWNNVREEFKSESFYRGQNRLRKWINSKHITSREVRNEIVIQRELIEQYREIVENLKVKFDIVEAITRLDILEEKEEAQLKLMDYNIDADNDEEIMEYRQYDLAQLKNEKLKMESKLAGLENKLQNHEKYLPDIIELEIQEVINAYRLYLPKIQLERERVRKMLDSYDIFDKVLLPEKFEALYYNETKKNA